MHEIKACLVCLRTKVKIFHMSLEHLRNEYNLVSGLKSHSGDGMPEYMCMECLSYTKRFKKFRDQCHRSQYILKEILRKNKQITTSVLEELNLEAINIIPALSYLDLKNHKNILENVKFKWIKERRDYIDPLHIPVLHYSTYEDNYIFEVPINNSEPVKNNDEVKYENDASNASQNVHDIFKSNQNDGNVLDNGVNISEDDNDNDAFGNEDHDNDIPNNDDHGNDIQHNDDEEKIERNDDDVDGSNLDEEYAVMMPISMYESKAVVDVYKMFVQGKLKCEVCGKGYQNEKRLKVHMRMHDTHISGPFFCELCHYYYKTSFLLMTHMTDKHMYKYVCRKCPEVSFDKTSAKQHYIWTHLQKGYKKDANWYESRPKWLKKKAPNQQKNVLCMRPIKKVKKLPQDFLRYAPISQEEQYALVRDRRNTKNYIDSPFKCEQCFKGFQKIITYEKHMKKHDPKVSGKFQCDACKIYCTDTRKMYKHMNLTHLFKYSCQMCTFTCYNRNQARMHYRWHKNVTYSCPHCDKVYKKASTRLTHIRIHHPSTNICNLCGHSFVSETGLYCHKKIAHTTEEIAQGSGETEMSGPLYCGECDVQFRDHDAYATHFGSSSKHADTNLSSMKAMRSKESKSRGRRPRRTFSEVCNTGVATSTTCEICKKFLVNDMQARKHYETEHPGSDFRKRYMCDICGHTTKQYSNLMVHMRTHTMEKPYACPHCERRFSMPSNRDRHLVVHTGEKRYQCQHCNRRFTQSSAVKLHIQTVHLKIPYAPWDKNNRKRRKEAELVSAALPPPAPKAVEPSHDYLNAYITYNE